LTVKGNEAQLGCALSNLLDSLASSHLLAALSA
jgi:hypothetical protein